MTTGHPRHPEVADVVIISGRRWRVMALDPPPGGRILLRPDHPEPGDVPRIRCRIAARDFAAYSWRDGAWARA